MREALYNILGNLFEQCLLDLYAGSGSVGLEALSRGAKEVVFVEKDKKLAGIIQSNITMCGYSEKSLIVASDVHVALRDLSAGGRRFDIIFADPPYHQGLISETLSLLGKYRVLRSDGTVILQHFFKEPLRDLPEGMHLEDQRKYGENILSFLKDGGT